MKKHLRGILAIAALAVVIGFLIHLVWGGGSPAKKLMKNHPYTFGTEKTLGAEKQDSYIEGEGCVYLAYPDLKDKEADKSIETFIEDAKKEFASLLEERKEAEEPEQIEIPRLVIDYNTKKNGDYTILTQFYDISILNEEGVSAPGTKLISKRVSYCIDPQGKIASLDGVLGENGEQKIRNILKVRNRSLDQMECFTVDKDTLTLHFEKGNEEFSIETVKKANLIDPEKPMVAMTFDDGPGGYSKKLADLFTKYNGRATFFVLGSLVPNYDESLKYVYEQGHEVGSHTYSHKNLNILSKEGVQKEVDKAREAIHDAIGVYPTVTRTPYGNANKTVMEVLDGPMIHWSVDTLDWQSRDTAKIEKKILGNIRNGDIVLMHEIYGFTYQAVVNTIDDLAKKGYQFVTVSELLLYNDIEPEGIIYSTKKQVTEYK